MPFLHITTRIEGHKRDDLLSDFDENSFPTILVLSADGKLLARHRERNTLEEFERTLADVHRSLELAKKAVAGDKAAGIDLALLQCHLGQMDVADLEEKLETLGERTPAQEKMFLALAADEEVSGMLPLIQRGRYRAKAFADAGELFVDHFDEGGIPYARRNQSIYWLGLAYYAVKQKKTSLLDRSLKELEPIAQKNRFIKQLRAELSKEREALGK